MLAESHSPVETVGGRLFATGRGSYDKAGKVGMGWTVWSVRAYHPWVDAPTQACPPPLRLINSVEQTSTGPSHGKVLASLSYEPLGVCSLVRRQTPVGHVRAHVTRESHQPVRHQRGYDKWWSTAATPDSTRMTQVSLYIALNNFVPLHCATWLLVPQTDQIHLPHCGAVR